MSTLPNQRGADAAASPFPAQEYTRSKTYFLGVGSVLRRLPFALIDRVTDALWGAYLEGKTVYVFGNGGSAALASHCACDLGKGTTANGNQPSRSRGCGPLFLGAGRRRRRASARVRREAAVGKRWDLARQPGLGQNRGTVLGVLCGCSSLR